MLHDETVSRNLLNDNKNRWRARGDFAYAVATIIKEVYVMGTLFGGLLLFFLVHLLPVFGARAPLVSKLGELPYKGLFALLSLAGLVLIVMGKGQAQFVGIWNPPLFLKHVTMLLMLPAFILLVAAYVPSNIRRKVRHPMLLAVKLWATGHLLINGDLASMSLFGSFLAYGVIAMISANKRSEATVYPAKPIYMDVLVVVVAVVVYGSVAMHHQQLFGIPLF